MPVTTIGSYAPTMQEFINHWTQVNATLGTTPLTLRGGYTLANLTADRAAILAAINSVIAADNTAQTTAGSLANLKLGLRSRILQFRKWVSGYLPGTAYIRALPASPSPTAVESRFLDPMQDMLNLWTTINADTALTGVPLPATLAGGYVLATFTAELTALRAAYVTARNAQEQAALIRRQRDVLLFPAEQRMKQYREVIQARFDPTSAFVRSLPSLNPPPGATPDPVELNGQWVTERSRAAFAWTASANPNLSGYSLRVCTGSVYRVVNETVVADIPKTALTFETAVGLPTPGAKAVYRIYVVLNSGNERGSNDAPMTRPA